MSFEQGQGPVKKSETGAENSVQEILTLLKRFSVSDLERINKELGATIERKKGETLEKRGQ